MRLRFVVYRYEGHLTILSLKAMTVVIFVLELFSLGHLLEAHGRKYFATVETLLGGPV